MHTRIYISVVIVFTITISFFYGGCHNLFSGGSAVYTYKDIEYIIRNEIQCEVNKLSPSGAASKPYSRDLWNIAWNRRIDAYFNHTFEPLEVDEYIAAKTVIGIVIEERRQVGLPELELDENSLNILRDLDLLHLVKGGEN